MSVVIWGKAGSGKTTLASTAPGKKLWLNFDPDGTLSLLNRDDIIVLDLSYEHFSVTEKFRSDDPFGLVKALTDNPSIGTVVVDSITSYMMLATEQAVKIQSTDRNKVSIEQPGQGGYSVRNNISLRLFVCIMRLTKKLNRHFIALTHEGSPINDDKGNLESIPPALSGNLMNQIGLQTNEIWHLELTEKGQRRILVRPGRWCKPMKSRMFSEKSGAEFVWNYDAETLQGEGIEQWYEKWLANGGKKIMLPGQVGSAGATNATTTTATTVTQIKK
ncbi:unnamed protein product [Sphagnum balticum]